MDFRATRRGLSAPVVAGGLVALAWAALTVLLGGGAAHADEESDGALSGLTSLVGNTVTSVTAPVAPAVSQVVAPVVEAVVAPVQQTAPAAVKTVTQTVAEVPVVGPITTPVVKTVTDAVTSVTAPVTDVLKNSPVSQITKPIVEVVTGLPIVGGIVDEIGVDDVVDDVVGVVDDTTDVVGGIVDETVPPVVDALDPTSPATPTSPEAPGTPEEPGTPGTPVTPVTPGTPVAPATPGTPTDGGTAEPGGPGIPPAGAGLESTAEAPAPVMSLPADRSHRPVSAPVADAAVELADRVLGDPQRSGDPVGAPSGAPASTSSFAASSGGPSNAYARLGDASVPPFRAWTRTAGAPDEALPSSPVAETDVSPD